VKSSAMPRLFARWIWQDNPLIAEGGVVGLGIVDSKFDVFKKTRRDSLVHHTVSGKKDAMSIALTFLGHFLNIICTIGNRNKYW